MNTREAIANRHSVRQYAERPVERELIEQLLQAAVQAPSAMNTQSWAFGVVYGVEQMRDYARRGREIFLKTMGDKLVGDFLARVSKPEYDMFYGAPAAVVIYATAQDHYASINCALAAENLMLAAQDLGLGTCWIGMGAPLFNDATVKEELGVPEAYTAVTTIIIGYPAQPSQGIAKKPPVVLFWK